MGIIKMLSKEHSVVIKLPASCSRGKNGLIHVETPNEKTKEYYKILGVEVPSNVRLDSFKTKVLSLKNV